MVISLPEQGIITRKAAASELHHSGAENLRGDTILVKEGKYVSMTIIGYGKDLQSIRNAFKELQSYPDLNNKL